MYSLVFLTVSVVHFRLTWTQPIHKCTQHPLWLYKLYIDWKITLRHFGAKIIIESIEEKKPYWILVFIRAVSYGFSMGSGSFLFLSSLLSFSWSIGVVGCNLEFEIASLEEKWCDNRVGQIWNMNYWLG